MNRSLPLLRIEAARLLRGSPAAGQRGQALVEMAIICVLMLTLVMGMVDFGRIYQQRLIMVNVSREAANLTSRGTDMTNVMPAMITSAQPLNLTSSGSGLLILSSITRNGSGTLSCTKQVIGGNTGLGFTSRIAASGTNTPAGSIITSDSQIYSLRNQIPQTNATMYVSEMYYQFQAVTPIGKLLDWLSPTGTSRSLPTVLYDASYF